ncbi:YihY/virulence factor BrkB family protein [Cohnella candidum]|uniref:YihY/virulence factor BrkB family protein n=1 Tax=Cohnella candidum TaxID=2674991 RepID=A0A3G3JYH6_9BACL|nr:YihY/virulence factor BrkB family protein [Cohnella candidum]AYQ73243.1 YihY/virulence factor BrkB family protein [Cohnella candidum]
MSPKEKTVWFAKHLYVRFKDDDVPAMSAQLTYYLILAFFPFLIFLVTIISFLQLGGNSVLDEFIRMLPADSADSLRKTLQEVTENRSGAVLSFGMLGTLWAASNGVGAIMKGLNKAYDEKETRPFWKTRGLSLLSTVVLAVVIAVSIPLLVFGHVIGEYIFRLLSFPQGFELIWGLIRYAFPVAALFGVFALLYWLIPDRRLTFREVVPGALFAVVGWIASSLLFAVYVNHFGNYSKTYGSLGGVILLLIWLYMSANILLLGGEINATLAFDKKGAQNRSSRIRTHTMEFPPLRGGSGVTRG